MEATQFVWTPLRLIGAFPCNPTSAQLGNAKVPAAARRLLAQGSGATLQTCQSSPGTEERLLLAKPPLKGTCQTETNSSLTPTQPMLTHGYKLSNSHSISGQVAGCTSGNFRTHRPVASARRHSKPWPFTWHSRPLTERSRKCSALPPPCKGPKKI